MPRFFVTKDNISDRAVIITGEDAFHIARSLRMAVGDSLTVSDGEGTDYNCRLTRIRDEECECDIISSESGRSESSAKITLFMAYPKGDKLETVIQKAVELGAFRIVPFESARCIKRPKAEKLDRQLERLNRIAKEAAKQCGRSCLPEVSAPLSFSDMLSEAALSEIALLCYENEDGRSVKNAIAGKRPESISVVVGSEGGFSPEEVDAALSAGLSSVTLGKRILRCETAPLAALAMIAYELEL